MKVVAVILALGLFSLAATAIGGGDVKIRVVKGGDGKPREIVTLPVADKSDSHDHHDHGEISQKENPTPESKEGQETKKKLKFLFAFNYMSQGVDRVIPDHFAKGEVISNEVSFSLNNVKVSAEFFDVVDREGDGRAVLSLGYHRRFGMLHTSLQHRWLHRHCTQRRDTCTMSGDQRHRTAVRAEVPLGAVRPFAVIASDIPGYALAEGWTIYNGAGIGYNLPIENLKTVVNTKAGFMGSTLWYKEDPKAMYKASIGLTTKIGEVGLINPEVTVLKDALSDKWIGLFAIKIGFGRW